MLLCETAQSTSISDLYTFSFYLSNSVLSVPSTYYASSVACMYICLVLTYFNLYSSNMPMARWRIQGCACLWGRGPNLVIFVLFRFLYSQVLARVRYLVGSKDAEYRRLCRTPLCTSSDSLGAVLSWTLRCVSTSATTVSVCPSLSSHSQLFHYSHWLSLGP